MLVESSNFGFALYLQAKAFSKLKEFHKAFVILQRLLVFASGNFLVWLELVTPFF